MITFHFTIKTPQIHRTPAGLRWISAWLPNRMCPTRAQTRRLSREDRAAIQSNTTEL